MINFPETKWDEKELPDEIDANTDRSGAMGTT
jgi:hypothetical protein